MSDNDYFYDKPIDWSKTSRQKRDLSEDGKVLLNPIKNNKLNKEMLKRMTPKIDDLVFGSTSEDQLPSLKIPTVDICQGFVIEGLVNAIMETYLKILTADVPQEYEEEISKIKNDSAHTLISNFYKILDSREEHDTDDIVISFTNIHDSLKLLHSKVEEYIIDSL